MHQKMHQLTLWSSQLYSKLIDHWTKTAAADLRISGFVNLLLL